MRIALLILLACIWTFEVHAQQNVQSLCRELSTYVPIDGVEFNPSASEVPADLNAVQDPVYGSISIPVEIDLAEYFDRPDLAMLPGLNLRPDVSSIEINRNGSVFYNGQEISGDIRRLCGAPVPGEAVISKPTPPFAKPQQKTKPKPKPKPVLKIEKKVKPTPKPPVKKSSVKVFNGPKAVIVDEPEIKPERLLEHEGITKRKIKAEKPKAKDQNAIDVEVLKAQDSTDDAIDVGGDDDSIIEGQYP